MPAPIPPATFAFVLVGAGSVGTAVSQLLRRAGNHVMGVASRSQASARRAADSLGATTFSVANGVPDGADVVLIATPDAVIEEVADAVAAASAPVVACHFSGSRGIEPLAPIVAAGGGACAAHPVQACPDPVTAVQRLPSSVWGVTCSAGLEAWADRLVSGPLQGAPVWVREQDRARWHAAAVATSNGLSALLSIGELILSSIGIASPHGVLAPLARGTLENAVEMGGGGTALTGPVVRGDVATVARHRAALSDDAELLDAYMQVARLVLDAARRAGRIDDAYRSEIEEALGP